MSYFKNTSVNIEGNKRLRSPQIEAYLKIQNYFKETPNGEALVVLPTGTGKSGLISIAPYGVSDGRVLIITPGLVTKNSISKTQESLQDNFWINFDVIFGLNDLPIINEYSPELTDEHLISSNIVYSNIQRLVGDSDKTLLKRVSKDFFDMIIIDESHHSAANSWEQVLSYFNTAKKLHVTGTPYRGDGQEIPGTRIHETPLSEVMRDRYVKYLKKETINAQNLFFTAPEFPNEKLTVERVLEFKDSEWLQKSVALSAECSMDVIKHSLGRLKELKDISLNVPHKILAVGCSIQHAEDLHKWYSSHGVNSILIHSDMDRSSLDSKFQAIENNECDVVVSVNMLMEGYDHRYLSILSIFRPYKSLNAFAQVVGRVLRAIPESEITAFEIDNNATVIFHEEIGLNDMWGEFQKEVDRAKVERIKDYSLREFTKEYQRKDQSLGSVESDMVYLSDQDSFLKDIDFNELFELKRQEISESVKRKLQKLAESQDFDEDDLEIFAKQLAEKENRKVSKAHVDPILIEKRPAQAREQLRKLIVKKVEDEVASLLVDLGYNPKGDDLWQSFTRHMPYLKSNTPNDGTLVMYVNLKLSNKFGRVTARDNQNLMKSLDHIPSLIEEVRKML